MGNVLMDLAQTLKRRVSVQPRRGEAEVVREELLLAELQKLQEVELWRVQWCLSQDLLQGFPPIPPRWFCSADAYKTAKTMLKCYHKEGALTALDAALTMISSDDWVYHPHHEVNQPKPRPAPKPDPDFVKSQRRKLISRMQRLDTILDTLQDYQILNAANRDAINIYGVHKHKNRALVDLVLRKGEKAQEVFHKALSQSEPFLLQELEDGAITDKNASESSVLVEMLERLISEELRCFQWLMVSDHMTGESGPPIGEREQLQCADRPTTQRLLGKHLGEERVAVNVLLKTTPVLSVCARGDTMTSQRSSDIRVAMNMDATVVEVTPEVSEDGTMFRLRSQQPGVFRCSLTGLLLEGAGDVVYQMVPWDLDFLSSKDLRPAGPLFRFTLLTGSFHRLHLPHCQLLSDGGQHSLSVAHVTGDSVDIITPGQVTSSHVIVDVSSFSCFGLLMPAPSNAAIRGLVLIFSHLSDCSLYILLLPRNVCITQVIKGWKQRNGAEFVETISDCELIPNQTYKLSGEPVTLIQPESSKFLNFSDYKNFLASFKVQLSAGVQKVELELSSHVASNHFIGWLFGSTESMVWRQVVQLRDPPDSSDKSSDLSSQDTGAAGRQLLSCCLHPQDRRYLQHKHTFTSSNSHWFTWFNRHHRKSESADVTLLLLSLLDSLGLEDLRTFQHLLGLQSHPIPFGRLEAADRIRTVDLMVQQYQSDGAKQVAEKILRKMNQNQLADKVLNT